MSFDRDIAKVSAIAAVPTILDVVSRTTGMGFTAVARVTEDRWITCASRDELAFGLKPGDELKVETTICHEIRQSREAVIIDDVGQARRLLRPPHSGTVWFPELHFGPDHYGGRLLLRYALRH